MIQVNELRYRNWITSKSSSVPFEVFIGDFEPIFDNPKHYFGIPLTEEWLAKLGYDLISENHYGILGHFIWKIEGRFYCDKNGMQLKHVHQLQNLYFALTGKELEKK